MTGLTVLAFVPAIAALMFWLRARREMTARTAAETRVAELERERTAAPASEPVHAGVAAAEPDSGTHGLRAQLLGVMSHELRSPISAILGYQELLAEGIFGPLEPRAAEAVGRIHHSAVQLLNLADGMVELARGTNGGEPEFAEVDLAELIAESLRHAESEGAGRGVSVAAEVPDGLPAVRTDAVRLRRVLDLLIAAAIKVSPNARLVVGVTHAPDATWIFVSGARLDPIRDVPDIDGVPFRSGAGLRLAMAQAGARALGATLEIDAETGRLTVVLAD
jgi:signal transduction histidine kinase